MPRKTDNRNDNNKNEAGKNEKTYFQVDRFIQQNGEWFYMTREGEEQGPLPNKKRCSRGFNCTPDRRCS